MKDAALAVRCRDVRLILTDVDGVLTDGTIWMSADGTETKAFHVRDGAAIVLAQRAGLRFGIISGRTSDVVERRARELNVPLVFQGVRDKLRAVENLVRAENMEMRNVAYIGDDLVDVPVMRAAAMSAAPADAPFEVRGEAFMVTEAGGGRGALREFVEAILRAQGTWERVVADTVAQDSVEGS